MTNHDLEENVHEFLRRIQLEQFFDKIHKDLHLTRLSHFDHVTKDDLTEINMSRPEQRRLFDSLKKVKKRSMLRRLSLKKPKKKCNPPLEPSNSAPRHSSKPAQVKSCLISKTSLTFHNVVGDGAFGVVYRGEWITNAGSKLPVAVKCLKFSNEQTFPREEAFKREASAMSDLDHPNVIHLYGIVLSTPMQLVMELAPLGSLLDLLQQEPENLPVSKLCDFVLQVASGMGYLESKRYIHRDLAARNLLLVSYDRVKIGDFGLMRPLPVDEDIYVMNPLGVIPFAWCAPESLANRQFSHASDVWAFGMTVVEIFSYGRQPWPGLNASQILEIVGEPTCRRPSKPDHCPDKIYSLLMDHCWAHKPCDRSKFLVIQDQLKQVIPEDVTILFEQEAGESSEMLSAQSGDSITVISWKSRLGKAFAKGQNKRTLQVGFFPVEQISRVVVEKKNSGSRPKVVKAKDISPPLHNSFTHCAHRGEGETPNWGQVMTMERQVVGKQVALTLPSKVISLKNPNNLSVSEQADADVKSNDTSISGIETSSLSSHGSSTSSSSTRGSRSSSTCAESGYYSNQNISITGDYESMIESRPITIPGTGNQALRCRTSSLHASCAVSCRQLTPNDDSRRTPPQPFPHFNSSGSPHTYHSRGERSRSEGMCESECTHVVSQASEIRPPLPLKKGVKGIVCSMEQSVVQCCGHDFQMNKDPEYTDDKGAYEYFADSVYEEITSQGLPLVPDPSSISSQTSPRTNHSDGNGFDIPPIPPPRQKKRGKPNPAMINRISIYENCSYTPKSRSFSLPLIDSENHIPRRENGQKLNSFSSVRQFGREILSGDFNTSVDSCCRETRTPEELSCSEAYENTGNIDSSSTMTDLLVSSSDSQTNKGNCEHPPAVPEKPRPFRSFFSKASGNQPGGTDSVLANSEDTFAQYDNSENLYETLDIFGEGEELDPWIPQNYVSSSNIHPYSEITENLRWQLSLGDQNVVGAEESKEDKNRERCDEASGGDSVCLCQEIFRQINNDCADVDATQGKLCGPEANAEPEKRLENGVSTCQLNVEKPTSASGETLCTRYSADQDRINRDTLAQSQTFEPSLDTSEVLPRSSSEGDGVPAQKTCISLVTVV